MLFQLFVDFLQDNTHMFLNEVFSIPGQSQGLIYKHFCNSLSILLSDPLVVSSVNKAKSKYIFLPQPTPPPPPFFP